MNLLVHLLLILILSFSTAIAQERTLIEDQVSWYNARRSGATYTAATINAAITAAGTKYRAIYLPASDSGDTTFWTLEANVTITTKLKLIIPCKVVINGTGNLTSVGIIDACQLRSIWWQSSGTLSYQRLWSDKENFGYFSQPFVMNGGYHGTAAGYTSGVFSTLAAVGDRIIDQANVSINYQTSGSAISNDVCWTIASSDPDGISGWTRVGTTAYYVQCEGDTTPNQPALPPNSVYLLRVLISSGAIIQTDRLYVNSGQSIIDLALAPYNLNCAGNGVNNAATIQLALDAVPLYGAIVQLPPGTCFASGGGPSTFALFLNRDGTHFKGMGREVTSLYTDSPLLRLSSTKDVDRVTVSDMWIEDIGTGAGDHSMISDGGSTFRITKGRFERLALYNRNTTHGRTGIFLIGAQSTSGGEDNIIDDIIALGTTIQSGSCKRCKFTRIKIHEPFDVSISCGGSATGDGAGFSPALNAAGTAQFCEIAHNIITRSGTTTFTGGSINVNNSYYANVHHNQVYGSYGPGIHANPDASVSGDGFGCMYCTFSDNVVIGSGLGHVNPQDGMNVDGSFHTKVVYNTAAFNTGSGISIRNYPGALAGTAHYNSMIGNTAVNNGQSPGPGFGLASYGVGEIEISNNICSDDQTVPTQQQGIILLGATTGVATVKGNRCQRNTANDFAVSGGWTAPIVSSTNMFTTVTGADLSQGTVTFGAADTSKVITFVPPQVDTNYILSVTYKTGTGTPATNSKIVANTTLGTTSFTLEIIAAPGGGNTSTFYWAVIRK